MPLLGAMLAPAALPQPPVPSRTVADPRKRLAGALAGNPGAGAPGPFGQLLRAGGPPATRSGEHDGDRHEKSRHGRDHRAADDLDPAARQAAQLAPPVPPAPPPPPTVAAPPAAGTPPVRASLEDLLPALVRRVAWSGDARRSAVRMELGAGSLSGATLLVQSEQGRVEVRLSVPPGVDAEAWRARIASRLAARGLEVDLIEVT